MNDRSGLFIRLLEIKMKRKKKKQQISGIGGDVNLCQLNGNSYDKNGNYKAER